MSAPTASRPVYVDPAVIDPVVTTSSRDMWMSGLGTELRHAVKYWRKNGTGIPALCGFSSPFWSAQVITGAGRVCPVCVARCGRDDDQ